ncbi:MAG: serine protease [Rhodobacteraceae bacterium]|nr:serine protease [Paracoccaceae bacterium]
MKQLILALCVWMFGAVAALAQDRVWIQIEAQPNLREAENALRNYANVLPDVAGFQINARWYSIALGPYDRADAELRLARLRVQGVIPTDSYLAEPARFVRQFWPIGANDLDPARGVITAQNTPTPAVEPVAETNETPAELVVPDETPQQARAAENALSRDEKRLLQTALAAEGFYNSTIDGLFGRGTRASMSAWQAANGFEETGILTTVQRAALIQSYNSILDGLGLVQTTDFEAGISMKMPMEQIALKEYEPPFAHYEATGSEGISMSLISQGGSRARFQGLFNVLQTLDVVPTQGPRELGRNVFTITGIDATRHTTIEVRYEEGVMKGFMLVWPANDEKRLRRVLQEMRTSFQALPGALDPAIAVPDENQSIDLLAGLEIRQPQLEATGFFIDAAGTVLTATETLGSCERISLGDGVDADVVFADADLGLAMLRPRQAIAPIDYATFQAAVPRLRGEVAAAGFSYGGDLGAPTLTLGTIADLRGLDGEDTMKRLELLAEPGDSGGPVFDLGGAVLGLLRPAPEAAGQILPQNVRFALDTDTIRNRLAAEGVAIREVSVPARMDPVEIAALADDITVLVQCW